MVFLTQPPEFASKSGRETTDDQTDTESSNIQHAAAAAAADMVCACTDLAWIAYYITCTVLESRSSWNFITVGPTYSHSLYI